MCTFTRFAGRFMKFAEIRTRRCGEGVNPHRRNASRRLRGRKLLPEAGHVALKHSIGSLSSTWGQPLPDALARRLDVIPLGSGTKLGQGADQ